MRLTGEYECKLDDKSRLKLPKALLAQIGESISEGFVVNRGFEQHLMIYPKKVWDTVTEEIDELNIYDSRQRRAIRYFYRGATLVQLDSSDRLLLPKSLVGYSEIDKDVVLFAYQQRIELWSKALYDAELGEEPENFAALSEGLFVKKKIGEAGDRPDLI